MPSPELISDAEKPMPSEGPSILYRPNNWFEPLDWDKVFPEKKPIEIDLGCGRGSFLLWAATSHPQRNFVGVDRLLRRLRRVDRQGLRDGLQNLRLLRIETSYLVSKLIPDLSVSTYHVLFPDPWQKRRHRPRRLINPLFLANVRRTLVDGGVINCATDHEEYFEWIQREFRKDGTFSEQPPVSLPIEARTDFEQKFVAVGRAVQRSRWQKR